MKKNTAFLISALIVLVILNILPSIIINRLSSQNTHEIATSSVPYFISSTTPAPARVTASSTAVKVLAKEPIPFLYGGDDAEIFTEINSYRTQNGLAPLFVNELLTKAAKAKFYDMLANGYWAHTSPSGKSFSNFINDAGYTCGYRGENLARFFTDIPSTMEAWKKSSLHNQNLLGLNDITKHYTDIGVYSVRLDTGLFIVTEFGGGCSI